MTFYTGLSKTALKLLKSKGQELTIKRTTGGTLDPVTGTTSAAINTEFTGYGAVFDFDTRQIDGTTIQAGDKRILLQSGNAPKIGDSITSLDGVSTCINFKTLAPAGEVVIYELQVRY